MRGIKRAPTLGSLRKWLTESISTWLFRLVEIELIPARTGHDGDGPATARQLHRFVRDVMMTNPESGPALSAVQVHLIEFALEFVDWAQLAGDRRLRVLDWSQASLTYSRTQRGVARSPGDALSQPELITDGGSR